MKALELMREALIEAGYRNVGRAMPRTLDGFTREHTGGGHYAMVWCCNYGETLHQVVVTDEDAGTDDISDDEYHIGFYRDWYNDTADPIIYLHRYEPPEEPEDYHYHARLTGTVGKPEPAFQSPQYVADMLAAREKYCGE